MEDMLTARLNAPLPRDAVKTRKQGGSSLAYVEGWWIIQQANVFFGYDGWESRVIELREADLSNYEKNGREMFRCSYTCLMEVSMKGVTHQDVGVGTGFAGAPGDAIEGAAKEAVTDALKRCARYWGNQFGLSLYDDEKKGVETASDARARIAKEKEPSAAPKVEPTTVEEVAAEATAKAAEPPKTVDYYDFLRMCKAEKERVGDAMYYHTINANKVPKANAVGKKDYDKMRSIIDQLREMPALYSEEGWNMEVGRLVLEHPFVESIVKGNVPDTIERRQELHKRITATINQHLDNNIGV